jgi:hypothetical protein
MFSSAEAITAFGYDNLVRLGASMMWIGFESQSRQDKFAKNAGVDAKEVVRELRKRGISVLGSGILCMEHHTPENMQEDIDFLVGLKTDLSQFMLYTPLPVTALYEEHKKRGILRSDIPFEEWHGQKELIYSHPHFKDDEPEKWLSSAFKQDYEVNSSSIYRVIETTLWGYQHLGDKETLDSCLRTRKRQLKKQLREYSMILPSIKHNSVNGIEKRRAIALDKEIKNTIGAPTAKEHMFRAVAIGATAIWKMRTMLFGDRIQPKTILTHVAPKVYALAPSPRESLIPVNPSDVSFEKVG